MADITLQRKNMVESQVRPSDVTDRRITSAMQDIARETFVPPGLADVAYMDDPLTVAPGRTLLAPRTFARLLQLADVQDVDKVLIVGALHGYSAAIISRLAGKVVALEADAADAGVGGMQALDRGPGRIGRAVVDEDQLERPPVECGYRAPVELLDRALLVQERHDDGEAWIRHGGRSVPLATR